VCEESLFNGVAVKPGDRAQAPGDGGPRPSAIFKRSGEAFNIASFNVEQLDLLVTAPGHELAQVQCIGVAGQPIIAS
jgi:hypothetical protein